jgi:prolyl 4-hydroxylase
MVVFFLLANVCPSRANDAIGVQILNLLNHNLDIFWVHGRNKKPTGMVRKGDIMQTNSYAGHTFVFEYKGVEKGRVTVKTSSSWYVLSDEGSETNFPDKYIHAQKRRDHEVEYFKRTGRLWYGFWPKEPSVLHMWDASEINKTFVVEDGDGQCSDEEGNGECSDEEGGVVPFRQEVTVLSSSPRVFEVKNFLTPEEADAIVDLAKPKLIRSTVGSGYEARQDETRTSQQTFLVKSNPVVKSIYSRVAKLLNIDEKILVPQSEALQVVYYEVGGEYKAHHDWGKTKSTRYATVLLYLNDQVSPDAGGETEFPKVNLKVHPGKGSAVFFYNLLEDGSADDRSLHAALRVNKGEKYLANVWVGDIQ